MRTQEAELETLEANLFNALGIKQYSINDFLELIGKEVKHASNYDITEDDLRKAIDIVWEGKLKILAEQ